MTTAYNLDNTGRNITDLATGEESTPFIHGAGHVDPNRALDPGLVYDIETSDYVAFLCAIGYNSRRIAVFVGDSAKVDCNAQSFDKPGDLNYPSFSVVFLDNLKAMKYKRVVKNVGSNVDAVYKVKVNPPPKVEIIVRPKKLVFSAETKTLSYEITFRSAGGVCADGLGLCGHGFSEAFGSIEWTDGTHLVRSPIGFRWPQWASGHSDA